MHADTVAEPVRIIGARTFLQSFKPLETIIDGLPLPRGGIVAVTGQTGSGKTTVCAYLQTALRTGARCAGREVTQGSVLVLAGENPDDYAMHLLATVQHLGLDPGDLSSPVQTVNMAVIPGTFDLLTEFDRIADAANSELRELVAVFVDTSAAFFAGEDENDNVSMRRHAVALRELTMLPGNPTVFVLCHPIKSATKDNLLPRGGGAFLAEIDANLTVWKDESGIVTLHHAGKIRGPTFEPIRFELVAVELAGHTDCRGRPIYSTAARPLHDDRAEQIEAKSLDDENRLLIAMQKKPGGSVAELGTAAGFTSGAGTPQKSRVHRLLQALATAGLVKKSRTGVWNLTKKGRDEANELP